MIATITTFKAVMDAILGIAKLNAAEVRDERKRLFAEVVSPAFEALAKVNTDYIKNFSLLLNVLEYKKWPRVEVIQWLRLASAEYSTERERLRNFTSNLGNYSNFFKRSGVFENDRDAIRGSFERFCHAIEAYFLASFSFSVNSWYRDCLEILKDRAQLANKLFCDPSQGDPEPIADAQTLCERTYPDSKLQSLYDRKILYTMDLSRDEPSGGISPLRIREVLETLPLRFASVNSEYDILASLCAHRT